MRSRSALGLSSSVILISLPLSLSLSAKRKKQKTKHRKGAEVDVSTMADLTPVAHRAKSEISKVIDVWLDGEITDSPSLTPPPTLLQLTRAPGESLKAFNARVDQAAAAHIVQVGRQATKTGGWCGVAVRVFFFCFVLCLLSLDNSISYSALFCRKAAEVSWIAKGKGAREAERA